MSQVNELVLDDVPEAQGKSGAFLRLLKYSLSHKKLLAGAAALLLVSTLAEVLAPILVKTFIDDYVTPGQFPANELIGLAALYIVLHILSAITGYMKALRFNRIALSVVQTIRQQVFGTVMRKPLDYFDHTPTGSLVSRITNDTEAIKDLFVQVLSTFIQNVVLIIGIFIAMAFLDLRLMLVCLFFLPTVVVVMVVYQRLSSPRYHAARSLLSKINASLSESIQGMRIVQLLNQQKKFQEKFTDTSDGHFRARMRNLRLDGLMLRPMVDFLHILTLAGLLLYFGYDSLTNVAEIGVIYAFINYLTRFTEPVIEMTQKLSLLQQALVAGERVFTLLDDGEESFTDANAKITNGAIRFEGVSFSYDGKKNVLENININIEPGQFFAVVGHTGSGKTTMMSLLLRFYGLNQGRILLDGHPLETIEKDSLRNGIGLVQQDPFVFTGTIRDNITLGREISEDKVRDSARKAQLLDYIESLPQGFDTELGERGNNLSTGQRQLLSLARTLAHEPGILILDEATANIDSHTEAVIQQALSELRGKTTMLAIAHRLSTITDADEILVLHQGEIVQRGSHQQLMALDGLYRHMYELQEKSEQLEEAE